MALSSESVSVFLTVLDRGSFSAAARALGRVPSAVSLTISQLETDLGVALFDRSGREPQPTDAARALEPRARHIASQLRQMEADALSLHRGLERRLTIAVAPELVSAPWAAPLAVLANEFPSLEVDVTSAPQRDALRLLHEGHVDLALVFQREHRDEREGFEQVASDVMMAVVAATFRHPGQKHHGLRLEDLLDLRQIVMTGRNSTHTDSRLILSRNVWHTDNQFTTLRLVQAGLGWALLPRALAQPLIESDELRALDFDNTGNQLHLLVDIVWSRERPLGLAARRLIQLMKHDDAVHAASSPAQKPIT
ncbi:MAG: HTH-type transcriptional regulator YhaJ [Luteibacter sp.]|uniref:LysR family transcriptional regulator n=1 Tax=Luteibacter sp. TaxID=1886636 RepID=UPI001381781C|nr:LysR family transcriptional regulator [Luteibacter sp.]KAF1003462.1 MAG: HTH-type transcriptional regulator YhaJ [Luteibacter sp.]